LVAADDDDQGPEQKMSVQWKMATKRRPLSAAAAAASFDFFAHPVRPMRRRHLLAVREYIVVGSYLESIFSFQFFSRNMMIYTFLHTKWFLCGRRSHGDRSAVVVSGQHRRLSLPPQAGGRRSSPTSPKKRPKKTTTTTTARCCCSVTYIRGQPGQQVSRARKSIFFPSHCQRPWFFFWSNVALRKLNLVVSLCAWR
jgi:hypothetical protein